MVVCDLCKENVPTKSYIVPMWYQTESNGVVLDSKLILDKGTVDLCSNCAGKIADMFYKNK